MRPRIETLSKAVGELLTVRITTNMEGDVEHHRGYVVGTSRRLLVLQQVADFHLDGYLILRVKDITKVRIGKFERTQDRILTRLGVPDSVVLPAWLNFDNWPSFFRSAQQADKCVAVESALLRVNVFALGEIQKVKKKALVLREFNATAKWRRKPRPFRYKHITTAWFDDEYGTVFHEYMRAY